MLLPSDTQAGPVMAPGLPTPPPTIAPAAANQAAPKVGDSRVSKDGKRVATWSGNGWDVKPVASGGGASKPQDSVLFRQGAAILAKSQKDVDVAHRALPALDEFEKINNRLRPSGGAINSWSNYFRGQLGNSDIARLNQLSKGFSRTQRQPGEGATSDFEGRMYEAMVGGADKPYQTNIDFAKSARRQAQDIIMRHQYREQWLQDRGSLLGADQAYEAQQRQARLPKPPARSGNSSAVEAALRKYGVK